MKKSQIYTHNESVLQLRKVQQEEAKNELDDHVKKTFAFAITWSNERFSACFTWTFMANATNACRTCSFNRAHVCVIRSAKKLN
jgi:phenylpropionate dioxygenase-like ring-hydroxylating dioxygenase large terminal subunit